MDSSIDERLRTRSDVITGRTADGVFWVLVRSSAAQWGIAASDGPVDAPLSVPTRNGRGPGPFAEELGRLAPEQVAVLKTLAGEGMEAFPGDDLVTRLWAGGWLESTVSRAGEPVYSLSPHARPPSPLTGTPPGDLVLSRFALVHRDSQGMVVRSPLAWCELRLHEPAALGMLAGLPCAGGTVSAPLLERLWRDLRWAGMVASRSESDQVGQWAPHELWFHDRTRISGRRGEHFGKTGWGRGVVDPLPARHEAFPGPAVDLYRPDLAALRRSDPSATTVLEERRTIRDHDDAHPITVEQLGEFLFRCARNRWLVELAGVEYVSRPYPAGGSAYELEVYPVVRRVTGLEPGMYHYDPQEHRLERVCGESPEVRALLESAATVADTAEQPQVLFVVAARFGRLMWTYQELSYSLVLKHVGVVYQLMYTVATAMGLAPCGLGDGDSSEFARATGLDPFAEASVGEFLLGSRPGANARRH